MADTRAYLFTEEWIRAKALPKMFGQPFEKRFLSVGTKSNGSPAEHEFDAVSEDGTIVVSIKALTGKTAGGRNPSGKIKDAYAELMFLGLAQAAKKYLVLTDKNFFQLFHRQSDGKRPLGVELMLILLPGWIKKKVDLAKDGASEEVFPKRVGKSEPKPVRARTA